MKHKLMTSTIASLMFVAGAAVAADPTPVSVSGGTIHFEGKLVNAACAVSTKSADQTVTLGQYRTASFTAIDDTTAQVPFSIVLNDCDPKVAATAAVAFSGQADNTNPNLLAVSSADNSTTATGVGIEILDNTSSPLKPDGRDLLGEAGAGLKAPIRCVLPHAIRQPPPPRRQARLMPTPPLS
ncbi:major type 1 subunit fimbrin (pilin) [Salmonella enterica subsp. enterica]|nr:major type 1 subunit fimbrin (pilin) [Salmonella enterica subsp. enterica]